jgi:hypothetical protein
MLALLMWPQAASIWRPSLRSGAEELRLEHIESASSQADVERAAAEVRVGHSRRSASRECLLCLQFPTARQLPLRAISRLMHRNKTLPYENEGPWRFIYQFVMRAHVLDLKKVAQFR